MKLLSFIEWRYENIHQLMAPWGQTEIDQIITKAKQAIPAIEFDALWQQGREMTMERALEIVSHIKNSLL